MSSTRLLLIEDDFDVAEMLLMYFQSHNYDVIHSDTGGGGIEMARTQFPTLILLDIMLPDMDGWNVCRQLRAASLTKYIPIIFLTQRNEQASKIKGLELGADDYIVKPFDIDELRLRVQGSIRRANREHLHEARTGLPTGPLVEEELERRRLADDAYTSLVVRIQGWREYNDVYSFVAGNDVMRFAGETIKKTINELGTPRDFVGIVEDDFVVLTHAEDIAPIEEAMKAAFNEQVRAFYSFVDADRGGIILNPDTPQERFVPIMQLETLQTEDINLGKEERS